MRTAASTTVQYGLAYGVGLPVFVLYRIGRSLRRRRAAAQPLPVAAGTRLARARPRH